MTTSNATHKNSKQYSRLHDWLLNHMRAISVCVGEIYRAPLANLLTILVIAIAVTLPAGFFSVLQNFQRIDQHWQSQPSLSLYLKNSSSRQNIELFVAQLKKQTGIKTVKYISPQQGLAQFEKSTQLSDILNTLQSNPLPPVLVITPTLAKEDGASLNTLRQQLQQNPLVDSIQLDSTWMQRLNELISLGKRITIIMATLFSIGVILIVGNTIRLITQSHRREISVLRLIGASNSFIRRPLLYRGLAYGFLGGLLAWILVSLALWWLSGPSRQLVNSYGANFNLTNFSPLTGIAIILISCILSLLGSWLALQRYLSSPN